MFTPAPWPCVTAMVERRQRWRRGRRAEAWAVLWLRLKGYRILARNFRVPVGGYDILRVHLERVGDNLTYTA